MEVKELERLSRLKGNEEGDSRGFDHKILSAKPIEKLNSKYGKRNDSKKVLDTYGMGRRCNLSEFSRWRI